MEFVFKKTYALSVEEKKNICDLYFDVFNAPKPIDKFDDQFSKTFMGYSYHGLMVNKGEIVGSYTAIPFRYRYFGQERVFALSVDTMIKKEHRGSPFNLRKMADLTYNVLKEDGISFVFGLPNENVYLVRKKVLGWRDIGSLGLYALPMKIGAIENKLKGLNILSEAFADFIDRFLGTHKKEHEMEYNVEKINDNIFLNYRYDSTYEIVKFNEDAFFVCKAGVENNVNTIYLIDVCPPNKEFVESSIKHIYFKYKDGADQIIYLGKLNFESINPYKDKGFTLGTKHMSGKILIDSEVDQRIFDVDNWNVNLSNFDIR